MITRRHPILSRLPIRLTVPCLLTVPVLAASLALTGLTLWRGRTAARTLASQSLQTIHLRIAQELEHMLSTPGHALSLNAALIDEGRLSLDSLRSWHVPWLRQVQAFESLSCISWDGADGRHAWITRYPDGPGYWFGVKEHADQRDVHEYAYVGQGLAEQPHASYPIDPRDFAPFKTARDADRPTWCEPFEWVDQSGAVLTYAMAYVAPYRDPQGRLLGVLTAQLTLHDVSRFLAGLPLSPHGEAFVIDSQGLLVADSLFSPLEDGRHNRLRAIASRNQIIAQVAAHLAARGGDAAVWAGPYHAVIKLRDSEHVLLASPFNHPTGLQWRIVTVAPESDFTADLASALRESLALAALVTLATLLLGLGLARLALRPLLRLVAHTRRIGAGELDAQLSLDHAPEFVQLSASINAMTANLQEHLRLRHSLHLAEQVQQSLLPGKPPDVPGLQVAADSLYCDQTGGDYYDFLDNPDADAQALRLVVGDVMGHGVPAAMYMATARGLLHSSAARTECLAQLLGHVNRYLLRGPSASGRFMTMLLIHLQPSASMLRWASAGHDPPILYDPRDDRFIDLDGGGLPLGVSADEPYEEHHWPHLRTGQVMLLATDGLWETANPAGEFLGKQRLRDTICQLAPLPAQRILEGIQQSLADFRGGARRLDDLTMVVVKVV